MRASPSSSAVMLPSISGPGSTSVSRSPRKTYALTSPIRKGVGSPEAMDALRKRRARQAIFFRSTSKMSGSLGPIFGGEPVAP